MALHGEGKPLTRKAFAIWTAATAVFFTTALAVLSSHAGKAEGMLAIGPLVIIVFSLGWAGRFDRFVAFTLGSAIAGLWPLYRWRALGDAKFANGYLALVGLFGVMLLLGIALDAAKRRGWIVESSTRRWLSTGAMFVYVILDMSKWPAGAWHTAMFYSWIAIFFLGLFWPARKRPPQHNQTATA